MPSAGLAARLVSARLKSFTESVARVLLFCPLDATSTQRAGGACNSIRKQRATTLLEKAARCRWCYNTRARGECRGARRKRLRKRGQHFSSAESFVCTDESTRVMSATRPVPRELISTLDATRDADELHLVRRSGKWNRARGKFKKQTRKTRREASKDATPSELRLRVANLECLATFAFAKPREALCEFAVATRRGAGLRLRKRNYLERKGARALKKADECEAWPASCANKSV